MDAREPFALSDDADNLIGVLRHYELYNAHRRGQGVGVPAWGKGQRRDYRHFGAAMQAFIKCDQPLREAAAKTRKETKAGKKTSCCAMREYNSSNSNLKPKAEQSLRSKTAHAALLHAPLAADYRAWGDFGKGESK